MDRSRYGLFYAVDMQRSVRLRLSMLLLSASFLETAGIVPVRDVDLVLDASGFAFGDQHPLQRSERFARSVKRWRDQGKKVILLPQALGPFENRGTRDAFTAVIESATLIYARDETSLENVNNLADGLDHVRLAPDFTCLVRPQLNIKGDGQRRVCIVPNDRMIEKASSSVEADGYINLLKDCIETVDKVDLAPVMLVHGDEDRALSEAVLNRLEQDIEIVQLEDPVEIKRFIGESFLLIGSRYHALVSALTQGIPCIATSWSHKYKTLFREYGCEQMILPVPAERALVDKCIGYATGTERIYLVDALKDHASRVEIQVRAMWEEIDKEVGLA